MKHRFKICLAALLGLLGGALLFYTTDREFINLTPTPGEAFVLPLTVDTTYEFTFTVNRTSLTRLGFWLKPLRSGVPSEPITIALRRGDVVVAQQSIDSAFVDGQGFTQTRFSPAVKTVPGEKLTSSITVPAALSEALGVALRQVDGTFTIDDAQLFVNGKASPLPLAYKAYFRYHPGLAIQIGALLILSTCLLIFPTHRHLSPFFVACVLSAVSLLPATVLGNYLWLVWIAQAAAWTGMYHLFAHLKLSVAARLAGSNCSAFTTYWTLHYIGGTSSLLLLAVIPFAVYVAIRLPTVRWIAVSSIIGLGITAFANVPAGLASIGIATWRDIFLDPYQVAFAQKTISGLPWHHYGSYVGVFCLALAFLGAVTMLWRRWMVINLLLGALVLYYSGIMVVWPAAYTVIIIAYFIAYLAASGLHAMQNYLGNTRTIHYLMMALSLVILLDLFFVVTTTLETVYL